MFLELLEINLLISESIFIMSSKSGVDQCRDDRVISVTQIDSQTDKQTDRQHSGIQ